MPTKNVSFDMALRSLNAVRPDKTLDNYSSIISTSLGLTLIEIQGDLIIPKNKPNGLNSEEEKLFQKVKIPEIFESKDESIDIVKFGRVEIDPNFKKATLFISSTQRLIGTVENIDPPLGILKVVHNDRKGGDIPKNNDNINNNSDCEMIDIINTKIIFKQRPLPIM